MIVAEGVLATEALLPSELRRAAGMRSENRDAGESCALTHCVARGHVSNLQLRKIDQMMFRIVRSWDRRFSVGLLNGLYTWSTCTNHRYC